MIQAQLLRTFYKPICFIGRVFSGWGRLDFLDPIPLGVHISEALRDYVEGYDIEVEDGDYENSKRYSLTPTMFHKIIVNVIDDKVYSVTYWSKHPYPEKDLQTVMSWYAEGCEWIETEPGYWYFRKDEEVRLWCSSAPAIGVGIKQYFSLRKKKTGNNEPQQA